MVIFAWLGPRRLHGRGDAYPGFSRMLRGLLTLWHEQHNCAWRIASLVLLSKTQFRAWQLFHGSQSMWQVFFCCFFVFYFECSGLNLVMYYVIHGGREGRIPISDWTRGQTSDDKCTAKEFRQSYSVPRRTLSTGSASRCVCSCEGQACASQMPKETRLLAWRYVKRMIKAMIYFTDLQLTY